MEKMKMHTPDITESNIEKIGQLFPNCLTERIGEDGKVERAIDFDQLRKELSKDIVEGPQERYQFTWPDKKKAIRLSNASSNYTLRPVRTLETKATGMDSNGNPYISSGSVNFDSTENLYIEGDNLDVLKLLREDYLGKIKVIYIDPPYNTGKDFVYADDFVQTASSYSDNSGQIDDKGNRLVQNSESNGRFHTDWLNMMYPRLRISRDLLKDDGVIFISIDDNEVDNVKKLCDEIFGNCNFIGQLILKTATDNNPSQINIEHEYMICYAKNKNYQQNWIRQSEAADRIVEQYRKIKRDTNDIDIIQEQLRKWIKANRENLPQVAHYNNVDERGVYSSSTNSSNPHPGGYMFDIIHPKTGKKCPKPQNGWRWPEKTFWAYDAAGDIEWGKDETTQPHVKKRIETAVEYLRTLIYEDNRATTKMLADLFDGHKVFDNPKPVNVLSKVFEFVTQKDSLVLDFFSGSASTAQAIMELNMKDNGTRRFIMVQLPETVDPKSEAYKCGYKNICEIGKERIRRAGRMIINTAADDYTGGLFEVSEKQDNKLDIGFRVLKLDTSNMNDVFYRPEEFSEQLIKEDNVKEDRSPEDLLFQIMLECNLPLSAKIQTEKIAEKEVFTVNNGYLIACFDEDVNEEVIKAVAKRKPYYFVMRDSSLASDNVADNFEQIFQAYSKDTIRRIL